MRSAYIPKPSRGRLTRWTLFLRTFTFEAHHIPGKANFFCDLLSRNGCSNAAWQWRQQRGAPVDATQAPARQFAIIAPRPPPDAKESSRDLELENVGLLPQMLGTAWPHAKRIADEQMRAGIVSAQHKDVDGCALAIDLSLIHI